MKRILVIGATSLMAQETCKLFARDGDSIFLVARDAEKLKAIKNDLLIRGAKTVETLAHDVTDYAKHSDVLKKAFEALGGIDTALIAHGVLPDQKRCEGDYCEFKSNIDVNFLSVASYLTLLANRFESARAGTIAVISSVAGDRGRQSNYAYGTAKGALNIMLQGLRNRLAKSGVFVVTIKPGFVDTPMTREFKKGPLFVQPQVAAKGIYSAIVNRRSTAYVPWFWWGIMLIIKHIPESIFKRMKL